MTKLTLAIVALAIVLALSTPEFTKRWSSSKSTQTEEPAADGAAARVMVTADRRGHFEADITINGRNFPALVDTGATGVALTFETGRELGLVQANDRYDVQIQTSNGTTKGKRVVLNSVRVGGISLPNVEGVVMQEGALAMNLLGMSFLRRLRTFEIRNGRLILEQ